jgi:alpha-galactosidase/6-phospho-beta-glucosidase family protein
MPEMTFLRDPTSEAAATLRPRKDLPADITGKTIALLDISKERSDEFLDHLEVKFTEAGFPVKRYRKASNSKNAAPDIIQAIVKEADIVVESLAD